MEDIATDTLDNVENTKTGTGFIIRVNGTNI